MTTDVFLDAFDTGIKYVFFICSTYIIFLLMSPQKGSFGKKIGGLLLSALPWGLFLVMKDYWRIPYYLLLILGLALVLWLYYRVPLRLAVMQSVVAYGLTFMLFFINAALFSLLLEGICSLAPGNHHLGDLFSMSFAWHIGLSTIHMLFQFALLMLVLRTKRVRTGLRAVIEFGMSEIGLYCLAISLIISIMFHKIYLGDTDLLSTVLLFVMIMTVVTFYFWLRSEIRRVYLEKNMAQEIALLQESLEARESELARLREDNDCLAGVIHKDNKLIPAMVTAVRDFAAAGDPQESDDALAIAAQLDAIYAERAAALEAYESAPSPLPSTGAAPTDAVLSYEAQKAREHGVTFSLDVTEEGRTLLDSQNLCNSCNVLLADLIENALHAVCEGRGDAEGGSIAVTVGSEDGSLMLQVSDSGLPFPPEVLRQMGQRKITTRSGKGGSGTGLMTLFRILRQHKASLRIQPAEDGMTKTLTVLFDSQGKVERCA